MTVLRSTLLWASRNERLERIVRSSRAMKPLVARFMPGETREEALEAVRRLGAEGTPAILTYLGENVASDAAADESLAEYERLLAAITAGARDPGAHISVKLTQLGWDVDQDRALNRVARLAAAAAATDTIVAIDMESSVYTESTIAAYERLARAHRNVALCLQAYLHRTPADVRRLLPLQPYIRLVKGAYRESGAVALQRRAEIDGRYRALAGELLGAVKEGARVALGTHDMALVNAVRTDARELGVKESDFEVQMLYGIQDEGRRALAAEGMRTRVLISYGRAWYPWFMRRLAEKPSNLVLVTRNLLS